MLLRILYKSTIDERKFDGANYRKSVRALASLQLARNAANSARYSACQDTFRYESNLDLPR